MKYTLMILVCIITMPACMPQLDPSVSIADDDAIAASEDEGGSASASESASDDGASSTSGSSGDASEADAGDGSGGDDSGDEVAEEPAPVRPSWLVISELLYDIAGSDTDGDVFVELAGEADTEISGYVIAFVNGSDGAVYDTITLPEDALIPEDAVFVVADAITGSPGTSRVAAADYIVNFDPQNGPDAVQLLDDAGNLIDALGYGSPLPDLAEDGLAVYEGSPAEDVGSDISLARVDTFDTDDNSLDFVSLDSPSPGVLELPPAE